MSSDLGDWIRKSMTVTETDVLNRHKERIAKIIGVTSEGLIVYQVDKNRLDAEKQIGAYLIGKLFARVAGFVSDDTVSNRELETELAMPEGTVRGTLAKMRKHGSAVSSGPGVHRVPVNGIPSLLDSIEQSLGTGGV